MIIYKTNGAFTSKSLTEWYFGKSFVDCKIKAALLTNAQSGQTEFKFWKKGTGYLHIIIDK